MKIYLQKTFPFLGDFLFDLDFLTDDENHKIEFHS